MAAWKRSSVNRQKYDAEPIQLRHIHVEDRYVGLQLLDLRESCFPIIRLGHDFELGVAFDHLPEPLAQGRVVVGDHDINFIGHGRDPGGTVSAESCRSAYTCSRTYHANSLSDLGRQAVV
jgi:hypothetical protein